MLMIYSLAYSQQNAKFIASPSLVLHVTAYS